MYMQGGWNHAVQVHVGVLAAALLLLLPLPSYRRSTSPSHCIVVPCCLKLGLEGCCCCCCWEKLGLGGLLLLSSAEVGLGVIRQNG